MTSVSAARTGAAPRVLVTGASGFVGTVVCERLARAGMIVRGLVRDTSRRPATCDEIVVGDLLDAGVVERACDGVSSVVHLAARVHQLRDRSHDPAAEYHRVNVVGTRMLLERAVASGATAFVLVSSVKAVGESSDAPWPDDEPPRPADPYGESKLAAEQIVRRMADAAGLHAPILRFPLVYGAGMRANMLRLFELVDRGVPLPLGAVTNARSLLYVENAADAIVAVLTSPGARRETFFVSDGEDVSSGELVRRIARALDRSPRLLPVPKSVFRVAGRVGDAIARLVPFPFTTAAVDRLLGTLTVDARRLRDVTGFVPNVTLDEGLRRTAVWYRGRRRATGGDA